MNITKKVFFIRMDITSTHCGMICCDLMYIVLILERFYKLGNDYRDVGTFQ